MRKYQLVNKIFGKDVGRIINSYAGHPNTEKWCRNAMSFLFNAFHCKDFSKYSTYDVIRYARIRDLENILDNAVPDRRLAMARELSKKRNTMSEYMRRTITHRILCKLFMNRKPFYGDIYIVSHSNACFL